MGFEAGGAPAEAHILLPVAPVERGPQAAESQKRKGESPVELSPSFASRVRTVS